MLTLTPDATQTIEYLLDGPDIPDGAGLRLAAAEGAPENGTQDPSTRIELFVTAEPAPQDEVIETPGDARVFVDSALASFCADKVLDASTHDDHVHFSLGEAGS